MKVKLFWWYGACGHQFDGFVQSAEEPDFPGMNAYGPYRTLGEAKADALGYYRAEIDIARNNIKQIKAFKKS